MGFIFDFDFRLPYSEGWMFNFNHLMIIVFFILAFSALYFGLHAKTQKGILITKLSLIFALVFFEVGRMIFRVAEQRHRIAMNPGADYYVNWWTTWSFEICATMVWVTVGTLIASCLVNKDNKTLIVFKNILFGAGAVGAGLTFIMPTNIHANRPVFHWVNGQSIITHLLLVFVPFYLIKIGELKIHIRNMWMAALGFFGVLTIAITVAHVSGYNFFIVLHDNLFDRIIGGGFPHPTQIIVIFLVGLLLGTMLYGGAHVIRFIRKEQPEIKQKKKLDFLTVLPYITGILAGILVLWLPAIMGADFGAEHYRDRSLNSWVGIFILVPFVLQVILIYYLDMYKQKLQIK